MGCGESKEKNKVVPSSAGQKDDITQKIYYNGNGGSNGESTSTSTLSAEKNLRKFSLKRPNKFGSMTAR